MLEPCKKNDPFTSTSSKVNLEASRVDADLTTVFLNVLATKVGHSFVIFLFQTDQKVAAKNVMWNFTRTMQKLLISSFSLLHLSAPHQGLKFKTSKTSFNKDQPW